MWSSGTFSVAYDNGMNEEEAQIDWLAPPLVASKETHPTYPNGTAVQANWKNAGSWYLGKVVCMWEDGTFAIDYDDGSKEETTDVSNIRLA